MASMLDQAANNLLLKDIESLDAESFLFSSGAFSVYCSNAYQIPHILKEIARLRNISFHDMGANHDAAPMLDQYDEIYHHLFIWNHERHEVVGSYRVGFFHDILKTKNIESLYVSSLYNISPQFFKELGSGFELGRTFVRPEYQKSFSALLLLWKGVGKLVTRNPNCRYFYGLVSVGNNYNVASQKLMVSYLYAYLNNPHLEKYVQPLYAPESQLGPIDAELVKNVKNLDELDMAISKIEHDGLKAPILLKKYLKFDTRIICCGLDPDFDCLDLFCLCDLKTTDPKVLHKFLGIENLEGFFSQN